MQLPLWTCVLFILGEYLGKEHGIPFIRNDQSFLSVSCFSSLWCCVRVALYPRQQVASVFPTLAFLMYVRRVSCGFDLNFPDGVGHFRVLVSHLYSFCEMSVQIFCSFLNLVVCLLLLSCQSSLDVLGTNPLSDNVL